MTDEEKRLWLCGDKDCTSCRTKHICLIYKKLEEKLYGRKQNKIR